MTYVKATLKIGPNIPKYLFQSYVHRSGRTARAKKEGLSVMLIDPSENQFYRRMCRTLNRDEDLGPVSVKLSMMFVVLLRSGGSGYIYFCIFCFNS